MSMNSVHTLCELLWHSGVHATHVVGFVSRIHLLFSPRFISILQLVAVWTNDGSGGGRPNGADTYLLGNEKEQKYSYTHTERQPN